MRAGPRVFDHAVFVRGRKNFWEAMNDTGAVFFLCVSKMEGHARC